MSRSRSESMDNNQNKKIIQPSIENKIIKRVQVLPYFFLSTALQRESPLSYTKDSFHVCNK